MAGSVYGTLFKVSTWGESHGKAVGVTVDGCPADVELCEADIQRFLDRRKPGTSKFTTSRKESDEVEILSGVFEGRTLGTPISLLVKNADAHSKDYSDIAEVYRPGHADYPFDEKYGIRDYRGGGRSSGRETIGRVCAGAIASKVLEMLGVRLVAYVKSIGPVNVPEDEYDYNVIFENSAVMPSMKYAKEAEEYIEKLKKEGDSTGGIVECRIAGLPAGIGDTVFEKLDANLFKAMGSIGGVKGVEIGDGFAVANSVGSENNDAFTTDDFGRIKKETNHSGGTLGGMSDGSMVVLRAAFKPTPSISKTQRTVNKAGEQTTIEIKGRHDPVIVTRAAVVVECMAAITVLDLMFTNMCANIDDVVGFYRTLQ